MPLLLLKLSRLAAFAFLVLGFCLPWFRVPVGLKEGFLGTYKVLYGEPVSTLGFKALAAGILLGAYWLGRHRKRVNPPKRTSPFAASGAILLALIGIAYPALTMQRCALLSAHAAWLQAQNSSLIKPNGDSFTSQEYEYQAGQPNVNAREVLPRAFEAIPPPLVSSFADLRLCRLEDAVNWLGLSQPFCEFVYYGWFGMLFGSFLLSISFVRPGKAKGLSVQLGPAHSIRPLAVLGVLAICFLCLLPILMAGREMARAKTATLEGKFALGLHHLDMAQAWVPVFAYDSDLIYQRGWLKRKLGLNSPEVEVYAAIREEIEGFNARAAHHYWELLEGDEPGPVREEAFRGALRLALNDFNSGLSDSASSRLAQLTQIDPTCVKAYYALQLASLRGLQKDQLERNAAKFETLCASFQSLEKKTLIASAHRRAAELEFDYRDIDKLGAEMRASITP